MNPRLLALAAVICAAAPVANAIVSRHDVETVATEAQARRFAAIAKILPGGEGVLIAPTWVLTAAHVGTGPSLGRLRARLGGIDYRVREVVSVEGWEPGRGDMALLRLTSPVRGVAPLELFGGELVEGSVVLLAGRGKHGDGQRKIVGHDGKFRVANNAVSKLEPDRIFIRLDAPGNGALSAEGISGPGDSGTPVLVDHDGTLEVAGIGSVGISAGPGRYGEYGSEDVFIRTSYYRDWIEATLASPAPGRAPSVR